MATVVGPNMQPLHRKPISGYPRTTGSTQQAPAMDAPSIAPPYPVQNRMATMGYNNPQAQQGSTQTSSRRTLSNATSSTSSTNTNSALSRVPTNSALANSIRRSTSSRSTASASPTSYVALMRKQKATVWCDRAQHQDPRILQAQRQAKMRAVMEVAGGQNHNPAGARVSTSSSGITGGVRSKIRHHGAPKAKGYNAGNLSGAGVPMRLSASEVDEGDSDDEVRYHQRSESGRSSLGSGQRLHGYATGQKGYGQEYSPSGGVSPNEGMSDLAEEETPVPARYGDESNDYFQHQGGAGGSGSSGEAETNFGSVGGLPPTRLRADSEQISGDELRRRGSVDDRAMTMSAGRLFVANPDLSD